MKDERIALAGTLALLSATVAALFAVALGAEEKEVPLAGDGASGTEQGARLDSDELLDLSIERAPLVARRVAAIRGIRFDRVPEPQVTDVESLRALATREMSEPKVADALADGDAELKLLGLLGPEESLAEISGEVTAEAAAYYDPQKQELFLLGDAVPAGAALAEFVLAHELTHALEDQAFGLPSSRASNDDSALAESALIEGAATALMVEYAAKHLSVADLLSDSSAIGAATGELPQIARAQINFAYFGGQRFVDELIKASAGEWDLVDFAYERRLPTSTEQILHPEKYLQDEQPLPVAGPRRAGPGWSEADSGAVGEFVTREILRQDAVEVGADAAAAGWGGDRYRLFRRESAAEGCAEDCRSDHALAIAWRGDDAKEAAELRSALDAFVERSLGGVPAGEGSFELDGGWASVAGTGDVATLGLAPDAELAGRLARPVAQPG